MKWLWGGPSEIDKMDTSLWLGDTGASCHITNSHEGMFNQVKTNSGIVFGNGQRLKAKFIGDKKGTVIQENGARVPILVKNSRYMERVRRVWTGQDEPEECEQGKGSKGEEYWRKNVC